MEPNGTSCPGYPIRLTWTQSVAVLEGEWNLPGGRTFDCTIGTCTCSSLERLKVPASKLPSGSRGKYTQPFLRLFAIFFTYIFTMAREV